MSLSKKTCNIYIALKLNAKTSTWENRLSIFENVNGKNEEVLFVGSASSREFIQILEKKLQNHEMKHFTKIRRGERYSKTFKEFFKRQKNIRRVSEDTFKEVNALLLKARREAIMRNKKEAVMSH